MKKNVKKVGGIKGFFMWLFRMDRTIEQVEVSKEEAEPIPTNFCSVVNEEQLSGRPKRGYNVREEGDSPFSVKAGGLESELKTKTEKPKEKKVKQNLSSKYNPNVKRGKNGRFQSLK